MGGLDKMVRRIERSAKTAEVASALEFVLEGLHLSRRLNRDQVAGKLLYRS